MEMQHTMGDTAMENSAVTIVSIVVAIVAALISGASLALSIYIWRRQIRAENPAVTADEDGDASLKNRTYRVRVAVRSKSKEAYRLDWIEVLDPADARLWGIEAAARMQRSDFYQQTPANPTLEGQNGLRVLPMRAEFDPKHVRFPHSDTGYAGPPAQPFLPYTEERILVWGLEIGGGKKVRLKVGFSSDAAPEKPLTREVDAVIHSYNAWA
jgi:hypothetical protein